MIINKRHQQVFAEIDIIADQLSSQKLLQCYQQIQMQKIRQQVMIQWKTTLRIEQAKKIINSYNNTFW